MLLSQESPAGSIAAPTSASACHWPRGTAKWTVAADVGRRPRAGQTPPASAKGAVECAEVVDQLLGLLAGREMPARGHRRPSFQIEVALRPFARRDEQLPGKNAQCRRRL